MNSVVSLPPCSSKPAVLASFWKVTKVDRVIAKYSGVVALARCIVNVARLQQTRNKAGLLKLCRVYHDQYSLVCYKSRMKK